eukprot:jgi/Chlat1/9190/Chrsp97S08460
MRRRNPSNACEACERNPAAVYCKADSAYLCLLCDSSIHAANKLASRHERVLCKSDFTAELRDAMLESMEAQWLQQTDTPDIKPCTSNDLNFSVGELESMLDMKPESPVPLAYTNASTSGRKECLHQLQEAPDVMMQRGMSWKDENITSSAAKLSSGSQAANNEFIATLQASDQYRSPRPAVTTNQSLQNMQDELSQVPTNFMGMYQVVPTLGGQNEACMQRPGQSCFASMRSFSAGNLSILPPDLDYMSMFSQSAEQQTPTDKSLESPHDGLTRNDRLLRFRQKKERLSYKKLVRYESRKVLADARPRIKGRFVKMHSPSDGHTLPVL